MVESGREGSDSETSASETPAMAAARRRAGKGSLPANSAGRLSANPVLLRKFFSVAAAFFCGNARWKARWLTLLMLALCCTSTGLLVMLSYTQRDLSTALSEYNKAGFYRCIWQFVGIIIVAAPLLAIYDYVQGLLALEWRIWLTQQLLSKYFGGRSYFDIKMEGRIDNPDQRIAEDCLSFTKNTVDIIIIVVGKLLNLAAFSSVLWSISPSLLLFLTGYSIIGVYVTVLVFGRKLIGLRFESLQREANFRYSLVRVRENAESIAFYRGEWREASSIWKTFRHLVVNLRERLVWGRHLTLFSKLYEYATVVLPYLIIAPRFFAGEVKFGVVSQTGFAFRTMLDALIFIVNKFEDLRWAQVVEAA